AARSAGRRGPSSPPRGGRGNAGATRPPGTPVLCGAGIAGVACPTEMTTGEAQAADDDAKSNVPPTVVRQDLHEVQDEIVADAIEPLHEIGANVAGVWIEHCRAVRVDVLMDG